MNKISIIVPVYNAEAFLDRCVQSILSQTYTNFELILIDDGSPDRCGAMCDAYEKQDSRIIVVHQENAGQSVARNRGLDLAHGDYISFIDSDDWVHPSFLEILLSNAIKTDADVSVCDYTEVCAYTPPVVTGHGDFQIYSGIDCVEKALYKTIRCDIWLLWNKLYRRKCFDALRLPVGRIYEDNATVYKIIYEANTVVSCAEKLYFYYQNESSTVHQPYSKKHLDHLLVPEEMILYFSKKQNLYLIDKANQIYLNSLAEHYQRVKQFLNDPHIEHELKSKLQKQYSIEKQKYPITIKSHPHVYDILFPKYTRIYYTWKAIVKKILKK